MAREGSLIFVEGEITKKYEVTFAKTSYVYVSKGSLSIGEIKLSGKVARGGVCFSLREKLPYIYVGPVLYTGSTTDVSMGC